MTKSKKIWLGILSILPGFIFAAYGVFIFATVFGTLIYQEANPGNEPPMAMFIMMPVAVLIFFVGFALTTAVTIYHCIHISKDETMSSNDKLMWILIVVILNWIGDIVYWYMKIWKAPALPAKTELATNR